MRIIDKIKADGVHISFEVFPPKTDAGFESVLKATDGIAELTPSFISVTYGAGGGTSKNTVKIASHIKNDLKIPALAHLTCVSSTKEEVHKVIGQLQKEGIENILALRGDIPQEGQFPLPGQYSHACELIEDIKKMGDFCIGAACYPEGHVEMEHKKDDIRYLKEKVDCGVDFITTQMFFNNDIFYNFLYRIREQGIMIPVLPGIMPITTKKQLARSCALSGTAVPQRFRAIVDYFGDDPAAMKQAGIVYATDQIIARTKEAIRYLGYGRHAVDEQTLALIDVSFGELDQTTQAKSVYRIFDCKVTGEDQVTIGKMNIKSRSLGKNLRGCKEAVVFGATLGTSVDILMKRYSLTDMAKSVVLQACAAAYLEEYCDDLQLSIGEELKAQNKWLRPRFSPGYGDFDIHHQDDILRMLDTAKKIGLTMTDSYMLTPTKSVTAIIGISDTQEKCHIKGCEVCEKKDCIYRRN